MYLFVSILILIVCVLLGLIVLVQNPKGGGLAANFTGAGSQFMGVRQTADFLEKATWTLSVALLVLALTATMVIPRGVVDTSQQDTQMKKQIEDFQKNAPAPVDFQPPPQQGQPGQGQPGQQGGGK
ncbi:MAG: preprotein translocase subunit SecG [Chlorobi bacterium]|nr:preprotein translocase subunit SecG [Chlorobiota bacterium]